MTMIMTDLLRMTLWFTQASFYLTCGLCTFMTFLES